MLGRAPIFLAVSLSALFVSLWFGPRSLAYISGAVIIGLIFSFLTFLCWRWQADRHLFWALFIVGIFVMTQGENIVRALAFPGVRIIDTSWLVLLQYLSAVMTVQFIILWAFRSPIKSFLRR